MIPFIKVQHVNSLGATESLEPYLLSLQISKGAEATKNTVTIELQNIGQIFTDLEEAESIQVNDSSIIVYLDWMPITTQEPVISATVSSVEYPTDNNGKYKLKVKATDKTGMLLSKLWAESITDSTNFNASDAVINLVGHLNDLDGNTPGIQLGKNPLTTNNVRTTKVDGSAFPKPISIAKIWKPGYEWLNDLSQTEFTDEDRPYVYWIDANNDLHWHYPYQKPSTYLTSGIDALVTTIPVATTNGYPESGIIVIDNEVITYTGLTTTSFTGCTRGAKLSLATTHTSGTVVSGLYLYLGRQDIYKLDIGTTEDSTYNFIIYNGGPTPKGYELLDYTLDETQIGKKFRMRFFDWKAVGKSLTDYEKAREDWTDKDSNYPPSYTPAWKPGWSATTVSSDEEYQASFEAEVRRQCEGKAEGYFITGKQKYKATCQLRGTLAYEINDLVNVVSPKFNKTLLLRVKDIKHQLNKNSWITDLELSADSSATST